MIFTNVLIALAAAVSVSAQGTSGISPCIITCSSASAAANGCSSVTDIACVCANAQFQVDAAECIRQNCPAQLTDAVNIQLAQCGSASVSPTGTAGPPKTLSVTIATSSATSTSPTSSSSAPTGTPASAGSVAEVAWGAVAIGAAAFAAL